MPSLDNYRVFKTDYAGRELTVEIGKYAEQANGACLIRCGETVVNVTVCMAEQPREGMDFFPLSVDYEEKMFAVGKIPGGFKKREGRASDKAILVARLIDRPIRPLFPKGIFNDVVVVATALSVDPDIAPEPLAMIGSWLYPFRIFLGRVPRVRSSWAASTENISSIRPLRKRKRALFTFPLRAPRTRF